MTFKPTGAGLKPTISIITVTFEAKTVLPGLITSLREQNDQDFEWIIVDGASSDGTLELISNAKDVVTKWISEPDFGIYHAMNKALQMVATDYYLVLGADDRLNPDAISNYRRVAQQSAADLITAGIMRNGKIDMGKPNWPWLYAHHAYVSEHSVGSLIRHSLHKHYGFYSQRFPIGADLLFLKNVCANPETKIFKANFIAGTFGFSGTSRLDRAGAICDYFRAQLETEKYKTFQIFLFIAKVLFRTSSMIKASKKLNSSNAHSRS